MKTKRILLIGISCLFFSLPAISVKPKVWIYTDMSDKTIPGNNSEGTVNDPDDISAMAGYILMSNEFNTVGIVVSSTHRSELKTVPNQATWASNYFGTAYASDLKGLNANIGGYPSEFKFHESFLRANPKNFSNSDTYADLTKYPSVKLLLDSVSKQTDIVNVLIWGPTTEPAIFVKHCLSNNKAAQLKKVRFIAHWTNSSIWQGSESDPTDVANCNDDGVACDYLKARALAREIDYYECGAIGQNGVMGGYTGETYFNQFRAGEVGKLFREGKYAFNKVDHSDSGTYWVLLGTYGVGLSNINPNGTNPKATEQANSDKFSARSKDIHDELLRRAKAAVYTGGTDTQAPTTPSGLTTSSISQTSLTLSWTASTDNKGVTGYEVYDGTTLVASPTTTSVSITSLACNTSHSYTVKAKDAAGNKSAASASKSVTTLACTDTQAPTVPSGLTASSVTQTSLTLSWTASTDNKGVSGYEVYDGTALVASPTTNSVSITGLTCNTSHSYTVKAKDASGNKSAASTAKSVTTSACTSTSQAIPGRIEAESYTKQLGVETATTTDVDGGLHIRMLTTGDYTEYAVNVATAGSYKLEVRYTNGIPETSTMNVLMNGTKVGTVSCPTTSAWGTWATASATVTLAAGVQTLRLDFINASTNAWSYDVNWIKFTANTSSTTRFEAESYSTMSGITKETTTDTGGGSNIASIHNNDYADYSFNVKTAGTYTTKFRVSSATNGGTIQVLKGTTVLGSVNVAVTGGWQTWTTVTGPSIKLSSTGTQTIRLKFVNTNTTSYLMNLNWWECAGSAAVKVARMETEEMEVPSLNITLSPNPAKDFVNLTLDTEGATILFYSTDYKLLKKIISTSNANQINVSDLIPGIYLVKVISADKTKTLKFIKN